MGKKTFNVEQFRTVINESLKISTCSKDTRQGLMSALESVLHSSGNYKGFRYLMLDQVPAGHLPGININSTGLIESTPIEERFREGTVDKTRVEYF